jgi:glycine cleavage system transcriptional repressor
MTDQMTEYALVSIFCPDRKGLVAAVTGRLFDLGINLGDTSFSVLGQGAKFTLVCELPAAISFEYLKSELTDIEMLQGAEITVTDFTLEPLHGPSQRITHRITLSGGDQPGMIACLSELFIEFKANIVRLVSETGNDGGYTIRISVYIPTGATDACLAAVQNTAEGLHLSYRSDAV